MANRTQSLSDQLRVFRKLDVEALSEDFVEKIGIEEGNYEYVDADRARDFEWTEEIMATTIGAAVVDADGEIIAEFSGPDAVNKALGVRASAKMTFSLDLGDEEAPAKARRQSAAKLPAFVAPEEPVITAGSTPVAAEA